MARDDRKSAQISQNIKDIAGNVNSVMDDLYRSTYMTSPQANKDLDSLGASISASLDKISDRNMNIIGMPSISKLYSRIQDSSGDEESKSIMRDLDNMFDNGLMSDDIYGLFMSNRYLRELDNEIDTICKYMPKLDEALAVQKDCVLSADHFSQDYLNFEQVNISSEEDMAVFNERIKDIKKKYKLAELVEEIYEDTAKYGEKFVYRVPYSTAIGKLLATKPDGIIAPPGLASRTGLTESETEQKKNPVEKFRFTMDSKESKIIDESGTVSMATSLTEGYSGTGNSKDSSFSTPSSILGKDEHFSLNIELRTDGVLESAVREYYDAYKKNSRIPTSLSQLHEAESSKKDTASGNIDIGSQPKDKRIIGSDGFSDMNATVKPVKVKTPGCVIKKIPREQVIPIYIDDLCMGYYVFEITATDISDVLTGGFRNLMGDPLSNIKGDKNIAFNAVDTQRQDETIRYVAAQLSKFIDKNFVNNNQDLGKEIYMILRYNDLFNRPAANNIRVTFVPPEDMIHFYFKLDSVTHRGISDLEKALVPAKIWTGLCVTSAIGTMTRGQDKRVYYVKQTVDSNIAATLLNTINQIKQGNFNIRAFNSINNILNITGRFNDFIIPTGPSGDPPIQFEVMPGQEIQTPSELMEKLEETAINSTGIPIEILQTRQSVDYAMQLTMSSSKMLLFCYKRQQLFKELLDSLINPIYSYEYQDDNSVIKTILPPPSFINITNTNQLVDNTKTFVQNIVDTEMPQNDSNEELRAVYTFELMKHYLGTHLDISAHTKIRERAELIVKQNQDESHSAEAANGESDY